MLFVFLEMKEKGPPGNLRAVEGVTGFPIVGKGKRVAPEEGKTFSGGNRRKKTLLTVPMGGIQVRPPAGKGNQQIPSGFEPPSDACRGRVMQVGGKVHENRRTDDSIKIFVPESLIRQGKREWKQAALQFGKRPDRFIPEMLDRFGAEGVMAHGQKPGNIAS